MKYETVEAFMEAKRDVKATSRNRLVKYKDDIKKLKENGFTLADTVEYLKGHGVSVSPQNVGYFIRTHIEPKEPKPRKTGFAKEETTIDNKLQQVKEQPAKNTSDDDDPIINTPSWARQGLRRSDLF